MKFEVLELPTMPFGIYVSLLDLTRNNVVLKFHWLKINEDMEKYSNQEKKNLNYLGKTICQLLSHILSTKDE